MVSRGDAGTAKTESSRLISERVTARGWLRNLALGVLSLGVGVAVLGSPHQALAREFNNQLDIQPFNGNATEPEREVREEADWLLRLGAEQAALRQFDKALDSWFQALALYHEIGEFSGMGASYDYLGVTYGRLGQYQEADDTLRRRLAVARDNRDLQGQIYGWNNVGVVLLQRNNLESARRTFEEALAVAQSVGNRAGEGLSLSNLGLVAANQGDHLQAIKLYEAAVRSRLRGDDELGSANTLNNLGDAYRAVREYRLSAASHREALRIGREARDLGLQLRAIDGLVSTYNAWGQRDRTLELLRERVTLTQPYPDTWQALETLRYLAEYYESVGDSRTALSFYQRALALADRLEETQESAHFRYKVLTLTTNLAAN